MAERVFIAIPLKPIAQDPKKAKKEFLENIERARVIARYAALNGYNPVATTIYYTQFLDDFSKEERVLGQKLGRELLEICDWIWIIARPDHQMISEGMRDDIEYAEKLGIKKYFWWHNAVKKMDEWLYHYDLTANQNKKK